MSAPSELQLTPSQKSTFAKAKEAHSRNNPDYAITLLTQLLKEQPGYLEAHKLLRQAQLAKTGGKSSPMATVKITPLAIKAKNALASNPSEAMALAVEMLTIDPLSIQGNEVLAATALAMDLPALEIFAYETMCQAKPNDITHPKALGAVYMRLGDGAKARNAYEKALAINPNDGDALKGMKDASAVFAQSSGNWNEQGDFRSSLKDADEARRLEQASRVVSTDESIDEQIASLYQTLDTNNPNLALVKQIAGLYEKKKDLPNAISWYNYASQVAGGIDPSIDRTISRLQMKQIDDAITAKQAELAQATPETLTTIQQEIEALEQQKVLTTVQNAKDQVSRYPNDLTLRFELGKALVLAGQYKEAVPELQQALRQPNVRHQAFNYLGQCYWKRNMLDLAKKQYENAASEMATMDGFKKEIIYNLGCVIEQMGDKDAALEQFKIIYEVDSQFKDVSDRVEAAYGG